MHMNKSLALLAVSLVTSSLTTANAASFSSADMKARQQIVEFTTQSAVGTSGARATAVQDAQNVALSRQVANPTSTDRLAEVVGSAVYGQSGPGMASLSTSNTALSKQLPPQTMNLGTPAAEKWMEEAATP
jgi:hypothetical protein